MQICVFGATGKTGARLVEAALADGHDVTAFVRSPDKLTVARDAVRIVQGDVADAEQVARATEGAEALISALGSGNGTLTRFGENIVPVMQTEGPRRIISLVGAGVSSPGDPSSLGRTFMLTLMGLVAKGVLEDASQHAEILRQSDLDWSLVRPPRLTEGDATGSIEHAPALKLGPSRSITRADLARFMVDVVTQQLYVRQAPMVANL